MSGDTRRGSGGFCRARATLRRYGKNRSERSVGARETSPRPGRRSSWVTAAVTRAINLPRSREVVNPRTWPMCAKIAKIGRGEREPTPSSALGVGHHPTQGNTGDRSGTGAKLAGPDEEASAIFHGVEAARSSAVVFGGRLWQTRQEMVFPLVMRLGYSRV